tara:strand:- start:860 stop:1051 length:192 start_codon:yes stop_codon:yes gene_type:complete
MNTINATFLVPNNAWVVTFGEQILRLEDKTAPYSMFFQTLAELDDALNNCGLKRNKKNIIAVA